MRVSRRFEISPWTINSLHAHYDVALATLGYEDRASHFWKTVRPSAAARFAFGFAANEVLSYQDNLAFYRENGFQTENPKDANFESSLSAALDPVLTAGKPVIRLVVDISSLSRNRIALILAYLKHHEGNSTIIVDWIYYAAFFQQPGKRVKQNIHAGPVIPALSGWWRYPELPVSAVTGLGYEENKALGAVELLQVAESIWTFSPKGVDPRYESELLKANQDLFLRVSDKHRINYDVGDPFGTLTLLQNLVGSLSDSFNVVLLPFGPKIFSLLAILVGFKFRRVSVWRISAGVEEKPRAATAKGEPIGLRVTLRNTNDY